ncbi:hypothetical protein [Halococcus sp. PRR34]|uniref:hypothetical protein n=1 Tax=Halococcus sp. PRR34 TaxID=3020830 RepID=UPI00235E19DC|nr:hypothetical protein [Halococcus sp. PRR34]
MTDEIFTGQHTNELSVSTRKRGTPLILVAIGEFHHCVPKILDAFLGYGLPRMIGQQILYFCQKGTLRSQTCPAVIGASATFLRSISANTPSPANIANPNKKPTIIENLSSEATHLLIWP